MSKNRLEGAEAGKALGDALAGNTVLKELDLSGEKYYSNMDIEFVKALTPGLSDNGAMTSLHVGMNQIPETEMKEIIAIAMRKESMKMLCEVPIKDKTLTELDVSRKNLGSEGALVVAEYLRDNGALSALTFGDNFNLRDGNGEQDGVVTIDTTMTEADFSNKNLEVGGAIIVSAWLTHKDNGALSELIFGGDVASHYNGTNWITPEPAILEVGMTKVDLSSKGLGAGGAIIISAWLIHKDNGAMTSLNLASNNICLYGNMDGIKAISSAIKVLAIILVPFSSLSDLSFNCWCLLLSPGYGGTICHQCHGQPHRQGAARQAPGDNALQA
jgi:hypothetical protein